MDYHQGMETTTQSIAPGSVIRHDGKFFLVYGVEATETGSLSCFVAVSRKDGRPTTRPRWMLFTATRQAATEIIRSDLFGA